MSSSQTTSQQGHEHPDHVKVSFGIPAPVIVTLAALTAIAPLGIDMYLASLPTVARELNTTDAAASMTLSAFMIGMALGQLMIGPLSVDEYAVVLERFKLYGYKDAFVRKIR